MEFIDDKYVHYSWNDVEEDCILLAKKLKERFHPRDPNTAVVGIVRGGVIPAALIARHLDIKNIEALVISTRDNAPYFDTFKLEYLLRMYASLIFVDEICDSGKTFDMIQDYISSREPVSEMTPYVCLVENKTRQHRCHIDFSATKIDRDFDGRWFRFPWEN